MSLIGDALRKARQEAADRESDRRGVLFSAKISDSPTRSNLGLGLALGAVIAVAATVAGGGAVWWLLLGRNEPSPTAAMETAMPEVAVVAESPAMQTSTPTISPTPPVSEDDRRSTTAEIAASAADPAPADRGTGQTTAQPDVVDRRPRAEASEDEGLAEGFAGMEDGDEVYILEADLGGVVLSLDFIVFRSDDPFVEINGVELHVGGVVEGYRVKAIEADRVRLSNGRRSVVLRAP